MENPPYYTPFSFIKQLTSSLREVISHAVEFHVQLLAIDNNNNAHVYIHVWLADWW